MSDYGGFREKFGLERGFVGRMREEEERILVKTHLGVAHGRANFGTGRADFL